MTTSVKTTKIYDEFLDFIAQGTTPETLVKFQFSESAKEKIADLIDRAKTGDLTATERNELNNFLVVEHLIRVTKAKAHKMIQSSTHQESEE